MDHIVLFTNAYAAAHIAAKLTYANNNGQWTPSTRPEMYKFLALIIFMGWHPLPEMKDFWKTSSLFSGNYARLMISSYRRFQGLLCFFKVVSHTTEDANDRLRKVRYLYDHMRERCRSLLKPGQNVAIDERMIRSKGHTPMRQYLPNKPTKWGFKEFAACDSATAIMFNFELYTGQEDTAGGLAHDVVVHLIAGLEGQHHILYTDNFYTSAKLADSLRQRNIHLVGTIRLNRRGFPAQMKAHVKAFERRAERGACRYVRSDGNLYQQWKDKRVVSTLSTAHRGNAHVMVNRKGRNAAGQYTNIENQQPQTVADYNASTGGVDTFDQLVETYRRLRRTRKSWKSMVFDMIDVAAVNSYRMFLAFTAGTDDPTSRHRNPHNIFQCNLIRQLAAIAENEPIPKGAYRPAIREPPAELDGMHLVRRSNEKRNCILCYRERDKELKVVTYCNECQAYLHVTNRDCFYRYHAIAYAPHDSSDDSAGSSD